MSTYGIGSKASTRICDAIDAYVKELISVNEIAIDKTKLNAAFKGTATQNQILNMAAAVDKRAKDLAGNLLKLKDSINNLNAAYKNNDTSDGSAVFDKTIKDLSNYNVKWNNNSQVNMGSVTNSINKKS